MRSKVFEIRSELLKPHIQYILFNQNDCNSPTSFKSYPNNNICLGISKEMGLGQTGNSFSSEAIRDDLFVYTTGLYMTPRTFQFSGIWDEICIDFHPGGYFHFFDIPSRPEIMDRGFSKEMFSSEELSALSTVFEESDLIIRAQMIEDFLISKFSVFSESNLIGAIDFIHQKEAKLTVKELLIQTKCSERRMYRLFMDYLGITPKQYMRILKIRNALESIVTNPQSSLVQIAYDAGYADQSHFIKEAKLMCEFLPKEMNSKLTSIDNKVIVCH